MKFPEYSDLEVFVNIMRQLLYQKDQLLISHSLWAMSNILSSAMIAKKENEVYTNNFFRLVCKRSFAAELNIKMPALKILS